MTFILWLATTYMPGNLLAMLAAGVCCYCAAGLFHEVDQPAWRGFGVAVLVSLLLVVRFPNPYVIVVGMTTIILCLVELARIRGRTQGLIVPFSSLVLISLKLFDVGRFFMESCCSYPPGGCWRIFGGHGAGKSCASRWPCSYCS